MISESQMLFQPTNPSIKIRDATEVAERMCLCEEYVFSGSVSISESCSAAGEEERMRSEDVQLQKPVHSRQREINRRMTGCNDTCFS